MSTRTRIIVIGAGFAGLSVINNLKKRDDVDLLLIDRNNFHTFTPLLYQVATCALDPSEIAYPVRGIYSRDANVHFLLGEVTDVDRVAQMVHIRTDGDNLTEHYDYLVVAAGADTNFLGKESLRELGFGLKTLTDGVVLRNHILKLFEKAVWTEDPAERDAMTTIVVVGGGPTGLETAGALYELYNHVMAKEYNHTQELKARVILIEMMDHLLPPYPPRLQEAAKRQLEGLGVEVRLGERVEAVKAGQVRLSSGETIGTYSLVWAAGVKAVPLAERLGVELQKGGRIPVEPTMQVAGLDNVFALGDIAYLEDADGNPYPQLIPVAQQQGKLLGQNLHRVLDGEPLETFEYFDKGIMATIGRRRAVAYPFYRIQLTGWFAWVTWLGLHLVWLMGFRNRLNVFVNWVWNYFTYDRSVRIILDNVEKQQESYPLETKPSPGD